jgi:hypothetical protein
MWRPLASRRQRAAALGLVALLLAASCRDRPEEDAALEAEPPAEGAAGSRTEPGARDADGAASPADAAAAGLGRILDRTAAVERLSDADRSAVEEAMQRVLAPLLGGCEGCRATVSYVDESGRGDHLRCALQSSDGAAVADIHVFHRPDLPLDAARSWAVTELAGHPATVVAGERLFVWPGRFEIRAFARSEGLGGEKSLEAMIGRLPLDALARL